MPFFPFQDAYPGQPSCGRTFREVWKQTLQQRFRMRVSVRCCDYNMCNGPNGRSGGWDRGPGIGLSVLIGMAHVFVHYSGAGVERTRRRWRV